MALFSGMAIVAAAAPASIRVRGGSRYSRSTIATLAALLALLATSCGGSPEPQIVERVVEKVVTVEVPVERVVEKEVEVVKEVPVEKVVEVVKEVPVDKVVEVVKEVPVDKVVEVEKVVEKEVVREVTVTPEGGTVPTGRELAQHTHEGQVYTLVEYDDEIAIFSASGSPVSNSRLADAVLRSYAWGGTLDGLDTGSLTSAIGIVRGMDDNIAGVRDASNEMVGVLDGLGALSAQVPLIGRVSAMDVIAEAYPGAAAAANAIRSLDNELNSLGSNADVLEASVERIAGADPSRVSGGKMDALFGRSAMASRDMEASVRTARSGLAEVRNMTGALKEAFRQASDTPVIGQTIGEYAETAGRFESELSGLVETLQSYESTLSNLTGQLQAPLDAVDSAHEGYVARWLQRPYDKSWGDDTGTQTTAAATQPTPAQSGAQASATESDQQPFKLSWSTSASSVAGGESFTLTVRMYGVREAGEHGGISVSFPSLTQSGGSKSRHSSPIADVEAVDYTTGLSKVTFHQLGVTIYHKDDNRQFSARHLLVESDDASWSPSDDRTLVLRITPKRGGEFPIRLRGWLCTDEYTDCAQNPTAGATTDQQGHAVELVAVAVSGDADQQTGVRGDTISAGGHHTCGLREDGTAMCWGKDIEGRISPPNDERFTVISAGNWHTCGLREDGEAVCWGNNRDGRASPPRDEPFLAISAGGEHTCGLGQDGAAVCWGKNDYGQASPPADERFAAITAGAWHNCGLRQNGEAVCWGMNNGGQASPPPAERFTAIGAGVHHTCGLREDGTVRCWGSDNDGQASPPANKFTAISVGSWHTCGLREDGAAVCWGWNDYGEASAPTGYGFVALSSGGSHSCGLIRDGTAVCWGGNIFGQASPADGTYLLP